MALSTPNIEVGRTPAVDHLYEYTYREFCNILLAAGFEVIESFGIGVGKRSDLAEAKKTHFYKVMDSFFPMTLVNQLAFIEHPDKCRSFSVFVRKTTDPDANAMSLVDLSKSMALNVERESMVSKKHKAGRVRYK